MSIKFLNEIANNLAFFVNDYIDNHKTYNCTRLIKYCEAMFYGQCGIYKLARYRLLKLY